MIQEIRYISTSYKCCKLFLRNKIEIFSSGNFVLGLCHLKSIACCWEGYRFNSLSRGALKFELITKGPFRLGTAVIQWATELPKIRKVSNSVKHSGRPACLPQHATDLPATARSEIHRYSERAIKPRSVLRNSHA